MKVSSTPLNSPAVTLAFVGPRQSSPTFCQSASVGDPLSTPGIFRICLRRSVCAIAGRARGPIAAVAAPRAATLLASSRKRRRLTGRAQCPFLRVDAIGTPPVSETFPSDRFLVVLGSCSAARRQHKNQERQQL